MLTIFYFFLWTNLGMSIEPTEVITEGYDVHTYFKIEEKEKAFSVYQNFLEYLKDNNIKVTSGFHPDIFDDSPHPLPMWEVDLDIQDCWQEKLGIAISWLMLNREGLSILIHPNTGLRNRDSKLMDHTEYTLWLGNPVILNLDPSIFD